MLPSLAELKTHLRLDASETAEDGLLQGMLDAAVDYASQYIGQSLPLDTGTPASVRAAILLLVGDLYENREAQFVGVAVEANPAVVNMLHFYRTGLGI